MASDLGVYNLERMRLDRTIAGSFRDHLVILDPYDVVYLTCAALSIEDQLMRVTDISIGSDGIVNMSLQFESYELYDDNYDVDVTDVYQSTLPDPNDAPPGVANVQFEEELRFHRERTYTDLSITFDRPVDYPWFERVEVWISTTTDTTSAYKHQYDVVNDFKINNIEEGSAIWVVLRVVNIWGAKQTFTDGYKIATSIVGKTAAPESLDALAVIGNDNTVNMYADPVADPDVEAYEFRLGDTWSGAVFLAANRRPVYSLTGVKPGTHTFWCNTLGTNGVYGASPKSGTKIVSPPTPPATPIIKGWTFGDTYGPDWGAGEAATYNNTEIITYSGDPVLKVTHTPALTGTYLSTVFDVSAYQGVIYQWIETEIIVIGVGTQWNSKFIGTPGVSGTTWADGGGTTKSWSEIFELSEAPKVNIWTYVGTTTPPVTAADVVVSKRMEILSAVTGIKYAQVYIEITDPGDEVYAYVGEWTLWVYY